MKNLYSEKRYVLLWWKDRPALLLVFWFAVNVQKRWEISVVPTERLGVQTAAVFAALLTWAPGAF